MWTSRRSQAPLHSLAQTSQSLRTHPWKHTNRLLRPTGEQRRREVKREVMKNHRHHAEYRLLPLSPEQSQSKGGKRGCRERDGQYAAPTDVHAVSVSGLIICSNWPKIQLLYSQGTDPQKKINVEPISQKMFPFAPVHTGAAEFRICNFFFEFFSFPRNFLTVAGLAPSVSVRS